MKFCVLGAKDSAWDDAFSRLPDDRKDVSYTSAYARVFQSTTMSGHRVLCALGEGSAGPLLYPFVLRDLSLVSGQEAAGLFDMTGLYGRNGVVCDDRTESAELAAFHEHVRQFATQNRVLSSFDRYHPVLANERAAAMDTKLIDVGVYVVVDLRPAIDAIEAQYKYSVRKDIRKAERLGVTTVIATGAEHLDDFMSVYGATMDRNNAKEFYYFPREFFVEVCRTLQDQALFIYAMMDGRVVSCELALHHGLYAHSFLGGTLRDALPSAANTLLKRDLMIALRQRGCRFFLLGAGTRPDDGIERYKRAFAPEGIWPSRIGGRIFDAGAVAGLRSRMQEAGVPIEQNRIQFYDV